MWLDRKLGRHKWKLIGIGLLTLISLAIIGDVLEGVLPLIILGAALVVITIGCIVSPVEVVEVMVGGSASKDISDFTKELTFVINYVSEFECIGDFEHIDCSIVSKYKVLPRACAESIASIYNEHLTLIKLKVLNSNGCKMTDLECLLVKELERSIDIQYKYHVEQNLRDEITALHNMNNHYADMLGDTDKEPK